jgi:hypothetical protein
LPSRRRSTHPPARATAPEKSKSPALETRVDRLEIILKDVQASVDLVNKRTNAVQAQLDYLVARLGRS